jgi:hypothetical protein
MDVHHSMHLRHSTRGEHSDGRVGSRGWSWGDKIGADETERADVGCLLQEKPLAYPKRECCSSQIGR